MRRWLYSLSLGFLKTVVLIVVGYGVVADWKLIKELNHGNGIGRFLGILAIYYLAVAIVCGVLLLLFGGLLRLFNLHVYQRLGVRGQGVAAWMGFAASELILALLCWHDYNVHRLDSVVIGVVSMAAFACWAFTRDLEP